MTSTFFKYFFYVLLFSLSFHQIEAQHRNALSLLSYNLYHDNPAFGGMDRSLSVNLQYRSQWNSIDSRPRAQYLGFHMPMYKWSGGIGIDVQNINEGVINEKNLRTSYNYVHQLKSSIISLGGRLSLSNMSLSNEDIITPEGNYLDGIINHNDPLFINNQLNLIGLGWELGMYFENQMFRAGISLADFPSHVLKGNSFSYRLSSHLTTFFQMNYFLTENIQLQPSITVRTDGIETQIDFLGQTKINGNIFGGMGLRGFSKSSFDALYFVVGHQIGNNLAIIYSYDVGISALRRVHQGSHELIIKGNFKSVVPKGKINSIIYNPRFL